MIARFNTKNQPLKLVSGGKTDDSIKPKNVSIESSLFTTYNYEVDVKKLINDSPELGEEGNDMKDYVSRNELDSLKEIIESNRKSDNSLNEERLHRLNDKIDHGNQLLVQKIDASNSLVISQIESVSKEITNMKSGLEASFKAELDTRFSKEREASAAEAKSTRMWLWALAIPSIIGIIQIVQAYNN